MQTYLVIKLTTYRPGMFYGYRRVKRQEKIMRVQKFMEGLEEARKWIRQSRQDNPKKSKWRWKAEVYWGISQIAIHDETDGDEILQPIVVEESAA